jgi:hypothetical protein
MYEAQKRERGETKKSLLVARPHFFFFWAIPPSVR